MTTVDILAERLFTIDPDDRLGDDTGFGAYLLYKDIQKLEQINHNIIDKNIYGAILKINDGTITEVEYFTTENDIDYVWRDTVLAYKMLLRANYRD